MPPERYLKFFEAMREATEICLREDPSVYLMGLGAPDPKGIFGTTLGLKEQFGERVLDMPTSENGMTGVAIGSAIRGMRPILTHQRVDFALLSVEQLVNQAAKWRYMFGGKMKVPILVRLITGRGWGQGPQHSQNFESWFAHVPGLKVIAPSSPHDAKGLLIAGVQDDNPVLYLEHRWLHNISGPVPEGSYAVPIGQSRIVREGKDVTVVTCSYMTLEAVRAADALAQEGIFIEIVDLRSLRPLDEAPVIDSVRKTGRLLAADLAWPACGMGAEIICRVSEQAHSLFKCPPRRLSTADCPAPTTAALAEAYYPRAGHIVAVVREMTGRVAGTAEAESGISHDVPEKDFVGSF